MEKKELIKRYLLFIIGLFFSGLGVGFTKHGQLGVSPISSVANVMSYQYEFLTMGEWLFLWNCVLIVFQILILRKQFQLFQLLQIPLSFLFGYFTDIGLAVANFIPADRYVMKLVMLFSGIVLLAFGISLSVIADVILNSGEALVKAIAGKVKFEFGYVKVCFDVSCVLLALVLSLVFFGGRIVGLREGTIISAFSTGIVVRFITKNIRTKVTGLLQGK